MLKTWFEYWRVELCRNDLKGNKNYFELAGGLSYREFESLRVKYSKCMKEIPGKLLILVRVSTRFELARVRITCIRSQLKVPLAWNPSLQQNFFNAI